MLRKSIGKSDQCSVRIHHWVASWALQWVLEWAYLLGDKKVQQKEKKSRLQL